MKIGIAIDYYKLPTFRRYLTEAGISFTSTSSRDGTTIFLVVNTEDAAKLAQIVKDANYEARRDHLH